MNDTERQPGFYWTKFPYDMGAGVTAPRWIVSEWDGSDWNIPASDCPCDTSDFLEIDERPLIAPK